MDEPAAPSAGHLIRLWDVTSQIAAQRDMRTFQMMVSHKFRTPLTGMLMPMELVMRQIQSLPPAEIAILAEVALRNMKRLHRDTESILKFIGARDLARSSAGFDLAILPAMVSGIGTDLGLSQVSTLGAGNPGEVRLWIADQTLELILRELMENARKFHPNLSPTVTVQVVRASPSIVQLLVQDDGLTLAPEQLAQVWAPYYQGEKDFTGEVVGMGLGLPMVAAMVWQVDGHCRLYNREDGPGVAVELALPVREN